MSFPVVLLILVNSFFIAGKIGEWNDFSLTAWSALSVFGIAKLASKKFFISR